MQESVNGRYAERCVHERTYSTSISSKIRRPRMACAPGYRTFFILCIQKNLLTSRSESATKALEPENSYTGGNPLLQTQ